MKKKNEMSPVTKALLISAVAVWLVLLGHTVAAPRTTPVWGYLAIVFWVAGGLTEIAVALERRLVDKALAGTASSTEVSGGPPRALRNETGAK